MGPHVDPCAIPVRNSVHSVLNTIKCGPYSTFRMSSLNLWDSCQRRRCQAQYRSSTKPKGGIPRPAHPYNARVKCSMCATVVLPLLFCHCYPATAILLCLSISNFLHGASLGSLNLPGLFVYSHVNHSHLDLQSHSSAIRQAGCSIVLQLASFTIKESRFPNFPICIHVIILSL